MSSHCGLRRNASQWRLVTDICQRRSSEYRAGDCFEDLHLKPLNEAISSLHGFPQDRGSGATLKRRNIQIQIQEPSTIAFEITI